MPTQSQLMVAGEGRRAVLTVAVISHRDSEACSGTHRLTAQRPVSRYQTVMTCTQFHLVLDQNP